MVLVIGTFLLRVDSDRIWCHQNWEKIDNLGTKFECAEDYHEKFKRMKSILEVFDVVQTRNFSQNRGLRQSRKVFFGNFPKIRKIRRNQLAHFLQFDSRASFKEVINNQFRNCRFFFPTVFQLIIICV